MKRTHARWTPETEAKLKAAAYGPPGGMGELARELGVGLNIVCRHANRLGFHSKRSMFLRTARAENKAGFKTCTRCKELKPLSEYYFVAGKNGPQNSRCKPCISASRRDSLRGNLGRTRAHRRGGISLDALEALYHAQDGKCHYTGLDMSNESIETSPSADRIDSGKPYEMSNLVLCCYRVNMMKNVVSHESFIQFCNLVAKKHPRP